LVTENITFGPRESKLVFTLEKDEKALFTFKEAKEILGVSDKSVYRVLDRLKLKKRIKQIRGGFYLLSPARSGLEGAWTEHIFTILPRLLVRDYYVGFWSALSYWGMTEQIPQTIYVVTKKRRRNLIFDGQKIQFVTYPSSRFFGYAQERLGKAEFNMSTREKTIVDSLAHPEYAGGIAEVAKSIWSGRDEIDISQLTDYARRIGIRAARLRLGYLLELLDLNRESCKSLLPEKLTGSPWLDPSTIKKQIGYSSRWGLRLNLPEKVILHWK